MRNVSIIGMVLVIAAAANAAVIPGVAATATDEYITEWDSLTLAAVNGDPNNVVNGSGFEEQLGWHYNHGFRGWVELQLNGQGTMWITSMDPLPSITFDLKSAQTLTAIKIWNFNHANESFILGFGAPTSRLGINRLNMGVQTMDIVLLADNGTTELATFEDVHLDRAPGRDDVDFGQVIDITDTNNVRYVRFDIQDNYGDAAGQVGLSEVRFYNDVDVTIDAGPDQTVWLVDSGTSEPNFVVVTMAGSTTAASTAWFAYPEVGLPFDEYDPNDVVIADVNAVDTAVTIRAPGVYYFTLVDNDNYAFSASGPMGRFSGVYDTVKIRVLESETDNGLIGYWPLDGDLTDDTGNGNNGSFTGSPTPVWENSEGISGGKSLRYNRTGSVQVTDPDLDPGPAPEDFYPYFLGQMSREFTISLWCKVDGAFPTDQQTMGLFERGNMRMWLVGDAISFGLTVQPLSSNEYFGALEGMGATKVTDGQWHFVVFTYDGFSARLYVDGRLDGEVLQYGTEIYSGSGGAVRIGARSNETLSFVGLIDDVKLYRLAKDQQEIIDAYTSDVPSAKPCTTLYEGDANGDCRVDIDDLVLLASNWLQ